MRREKEKARTWPETSSPNAFRTRTLISSEAFLVKVTARMDHAGAPTLQTLICFFRQRRCFGHRRHPSWAAASWHQVQESAQASTRSRREGCGLTLKTTREAWKIFCRPMVFLHGSTYLASCRRTLGSDETDAKSDANGCGSLRFQQRPPLGVPLDGSNAALANVRRTVISKATAVTAGSRTVLPSTRFVSAPLESD